MKKRGMLLVCRVKRLADSLQARPKTYEPEIKGKHSISAQLVK